MGLTPKCTRPLSLCLPRASWGHPQRCTPVRAAPADFSVSSVGRPTLYCLLASFLASVVCVCVCVYVCVCVCARAFAVCVCLRHVSRCRHTQARACPPFFPLSHTTHNSPVICKAIWRNRCCCLSSNSRAFLSLRWHRCSFVDLRQQQHTHTQHTHTHTHKTCKTQHNICCCCSCWQ